MFNKELSLKTFSNKRNDIQVLRAIAVVAVILYHLDFKFINGGFLGVDIFFVISGYLITSIILKNLNENNNFNFYLFYRKRIWRILPALFTTVFITYIISFIVLSPYYFLDYSKSMISTLLSISNIYFWDTTDYFDISSHVKPLLHTWSLGVEEQFYIFWPILIIFYYKIFKNIYLLFLIIFISSLLLYFNALDGELLGLSFDSSSTIFYLLPFRLFEFSIGALILLVNPMIKNYKSEIISILSLIIIFYSFIPFLSDFNIIINTFLALFGTVLFLLTPSSSFSKILQQKIILFIGLISYSLYLVHWPIIVFFKYMNDYSLTLGNKILIFFITICLGYVSYKYVEEKFRYKYKESTNFKFFFIPLILVLLGVFVIFFKGFDYRISSKSKEILDYSLEYKSAIIKNKQFDKKILLIGESHSTHYLNLLRTYFHKKNISIVHVANSGCVPLPNTFILKETNDFNITQKEKKCFNFNKDKLFPLLLEYEGIIIASRWSYYVELLGNTKEANASQHYLSNKKEYSNKNINNLSSKSIFEDSFNNLAYILYQKKIPLLIMGEVPPLGVDLLDCNSRPDYFNINQCNPHFKKEEIQLRLNFVNNYFESLSRDYENINFINSFNILCNVTKDYCPTTYNEVFLYRDDDHLNMKASKHILPLYRNKLEQFYQKLNNGN